MEHRYRLFVIQLVIIFCFDNLHDATALYGETVRPAQANELSFVVSLSYDDNENDIERNHFCTGTLISSRFVLTARHCIEEIIKRPSVIYAGCPSLKSCRKYHWKSWSSYSTWATMNKIPSDVVNDDIAVVELEEKVKGVQSAMLYSAPSGVTPGKKLFMAGWGGLESGERPHRLQKVSVKVLPTDECVRKTEHTAPPGFFHWEKKICTVTDAPSGYAILGPGDSGGPIYDGEYRVVGVSVGVCPYHTSPPESRVNLHATVKFYRDFLSKYYRD